MFIYQRVYDDILLCGMISDISTPIRSIPETPRGPLQEVHTNVPPQGGAEAAEAAAPNWRW